MEEREKHSRLITFTFPKQQHRKTSMKMMKKEVICLGEHSLRQFFQFIDFPQEKKWTKGKGQKNNKKGNIDLRALI